MQKILLQFISSCLTTIELTARPFQRCLELLPLLSWILSVSSDTSPNLDFILKIFYWIVCEFNAPEEIEVRLWADCWADVDATVGFDAANLSTSVFGVFVSHSMSANSSDADAVRSSSRVPAALSTCGNSDRGSSKEFAAIDERTG